MRDAKNCRSWSAADFSDGTVLLCVRCGPLRLQFARSEERVSQAELSLSGACLTGKEEVTAEAIPSSNRSACIYLMSYRVTLCESPGHDPVRSVSLRTEASEDEGQIDEILNPLRD